MPSHDELMSDQASNRLLIIDDDEVLLAALPYAIQRRVPELHIDTADTPEQAMMLIFSNEYDAIVSDIRMPRMNGLTLLGKVRAVQPATPVLLMTGADDDSLRARSLTAGAYAFLRKPLDPTFMAALLKRAMADRRLSVVLKEGQSR